VRRVVRGTVNLRADKQRQPAAHGALSDANPALAGHAPQEGQRPRDVFADLLGTAATTASSAARPVRASNPTQAPRQTLGEFVNQRRPVRLSEMPRDNSIDRWTASPPDRNGDCAGVAGLMKVKVTAGPAQLHPRKQP